MKPPRPVDEPSTREVDGRLSRYPLLEALIERRSRRFGEGTGTLRDGGAATSWRDGSGVQAGIPRYSDEAVTATIAYCEYVYER